MFEFLRNQVLSAMRVPPEPHPPEGSAASVRIFRAGRNYLRFRIVMWAIASIGAVVPLAVLFVAMEVGFAERLPPWAFSIWRGLVPVELLILTIVLLWTLVQQRLNYELRWYIVTDRSLRVRHGIFSTHELTTTFANIQEIRVSAGPLQKLLGLADLEIHSAGGGGGGGPHGQSGGHVARFAGLDNADEIRDYVVSSLRQYRDSGLGETETDKQAGTALAAAHEVLDAARSLRASIEKH